MPQNFSTLILPATIPQEESIRQLLLYFENVFLYAPAEESQDHLPVEFRPLCRHYAPVPFGDDLPRFQRLIRDMTANRAEYYGGGLSSLSGKAHGVDDESVWRLIRTLSPQAERQVQHETLLQARLLLRLAEVRCQEELEIAQTLAKVDSQGLAMLHGLTDDEEDEGAEMLALARHERYQANDGLERRLRAWAHLFLADDRMAEHWLLTTTPETHAILAEYASSALDEAPRRLFSLPLAAAGIMALEPSAYLREREAWRQGGGEYLAAVAGILKNAAHSGVPGDAPGIQEQLSVCRQELPAWARASRGTLDFYLLPVSLPGLFAKIVKQPAPSADEQGRSPLGVVAVLHPGEAGGAIGMD